MASFEQSTIVFNRMEDQMLAATFSRGFFYHQERNDNDDEFLKDLPAKGRVNTRSRNKTKNIDPSRRIHIQGRL